MLLNKTQLVKQFGVDALEEPLHKSLDLVTLKTTGVVGVDSIENAFVYLTELLLVDEDVCQILNSFLVVHKYL